jgi:hypothetical protein
MSNPKIRIHDLATDEIIDREMTDAEYAEHLNPSPATKPWEQSTPMVTEE